MAFSPEALERMTTPLWQMAKAAIDRGEGDRAKELLEEMISQWQTLQRYSINWITALLSFIGRSYGDEAVERALRYTGESFAGEFQKTVAGMEARQKAWRIATLMLANFSTVSVAEDEEKIILTFHPCGSGGRLINEKAYDPPRSFYKIADPQPMTFMRPDFPVYCAHCAVNNEIQHIEWNGFPLTLEHPPARPGEPCVHYIYKDPTKIPDEYYTRVGKKKSL